ncbi:MAG: hypothetical protein WBK28_00140 [Minisyncoccia bacterium]
MKPRLFSGGLFILFLLGTLLGYYFMNSIEFGICIFNQTITEASCINFYERIGSAFYYGMGALALVSLILFFVPKSFRAWKKFAIWATPIIALIFATYKGSGGFDYISPDPETFFKWVSGAYVVVSLVIIALAAGKKEKE